MKRWRWETDWSRFKGCSNLSGDRHIPAYYKAPTTALVAVWPIGWVGCGLITCSWFRIRESSGREKSNFGEVRHMVTFSKG